MLVCAIHFRDMTEFKLTKQGLKTSLDSLASRDPAIRSALNEVGYPVERRAQTGFAVFMGIIVSQQLSVKAASTIKSRVVAAAGGTLTPQAVMQLTDEQLRACGLSHQKIRYSRYLCENVLSGNFDPEHLEKLDDAEAIERITNLLGFGRWSAEMYLLFSLGRQDVWPAGDLAVQEAVKRLKKLETRPKPNEMDDIAKVWKPHRSAMAIFLWHYYSATPAIE